MGNDNCPCGKYQHACSKGGCQQDADTITQLSNEVERLKPLASILELLAGSNEPCICGVKIGNPMYKDHSSLCKRVRELLATKEPAG